MKKRGGHILGFSGDTESWDFLRATLGYTCWLSSLLAAAAVAPGTSVYQDKIFVQSVL